MTFKVVYHHALSQLKSSDIIKLSHSNIHALLSTTMTETCVCRCVLAVRRRACCCCGSTSATGCTATVWSTRWTTTATGRRSSEPWGRTSLRRTMWVYGIWGCLAWQFWIRWFIRCFVKWYDYDITGWNTDCIYLSPRGDDGTMYIGLPHLHMLVPRIF